MLATDFRAIGLTIGALVLIAFAALFLRNLLTARDELGSEIELAPNRKPYLNDEDLEGPKLDRALTFALGMLALLAVALPFYWLAEPGRQDGAIAAYNLSFESRGADLYTVGAQCVNCHAAGGIGGAAPYVLQDADGQFLANASWKSPALNDLLLRYDEDEVRYVLNFGRPGSPMAAWGTPGGGPLTSQQVDNIIVYLRTVQLQSLNPVDISQIGDPTDPNDPERAAAQEAADELEASVRAEVERSIADGEFGTIGEAVFNLGLYSGFKGGSLSCARCHTAGWSLGLESALYEGIAGCGGGDPSGIGFNLCGEGVENRFPDDTWKRADGTWMDAQGIPDEDGFHLEAEDGTFIKLDETGAPVNDEGERYLIIDEGVEIEGNPDPAGDLADCDYVSNLWQPSTGGAYPFDRDLTVEFVDGTAQDPPVLTPAGLDGDVIVLGDGRLATGCTIVEMPERTSQSQYDFIFNGAVAGAGYGRGGQSHAGMMPGFGAVLPPDYIQAVVDYERGL